MKKGAVTSAPFHSTPRGARRSVAEASVLQRGRDIDAHAVVDGALRGDLLQIEGLRQAVEVPGEFLAVRHELHDFTVVHVHEAGVRADDDGAFGSGGGCRLAIAVGIGQGNGRQARRGQREYGNGFYKRLHGISPIHKVEGIQGTWVAGVLYVASLYDSAPGRNLTGELHFCNAAAPWSVPGLCDVSALERHLESNQAEVALPSQRA